jgi:hypothetical protein
METIAVTPAPSPAAVSSGQPQTNRAGEDTSFAPSLSHAVASRHRIKADRSEKHSPKTASTQIEKVIEEKNSRDSDQLEKVKTRSDIRKKSISPPNNITEQKQTDKPSSTPSSKTDTKSETFAVDTTSDPSIIFAGGIAGCLFGLQYDTSLSDSQETIQTLTNGLSTVNQGDSIPSGILIDSGKNTLTSGQMKSPLSSDTVNPKILESPTDLFFSGKQEPLNILRNSSELQSINQGGETANTVIPVFVQEQPAVTLNSGQNLLQNGNGKEQKTLMSQQLQQILSENGADISIETQQAPPKNRAAGLDALSAPLFTITAASSQETTMVTESAAGTAIASLSKELLPGEKTTDKSPSGLEDNHPSILTKSDDQGQKVTAKFQEKDTLSQNTADHRQTTISNPVSSLETVGTSQQTGQFSFSSILTQNLQTAQHTTGTGTAGSNALPLWTPSQENALINQVMQNFQINSSSPASKLILKLHPEELGELKIDIQMKDGAIKANIFTQTVQVQQVLEKYVPKLKYFMEQQGLTVNDIQITNTSEDVGGHDLFQKDFTDSHGFSQPGKSTKSTPFADLTLEKAFIKSSDALPGVNVTV